MVARWVSHRFGQQYMVKCLVLEKVVSSKLAIRVLIYLDQRFGDAQVVVRNQGETQLY